LRLEQLWDETPEPFDMDEGEEEFEPVEEGPPEILPGPREGQRETVQARALLEKAERLLPNTQPDDRTEIERLMTNVRTALTDRKWDQLTTACNELSDVLFYLEE
jgi:molecular chaperone DnaK